MGCEQPRGARCPDHRRRRWYRLGDRSHRGGPRRARADSRHHGIRARPLAKELGDSATALVADLTDLAAVKKLWDDAWAVKGHVDVLVNNAGAYPPAPLDAPLEEWLKVWDFSLDLHLKAPAVLCREAVAAYAGLRPGRHHHQPGVACCVSRRGSGVLALRGSQGRRGCDDAHDRTPVRPSTA